MNDVFTPPFEVVEQHIQSAGQIVDYWHEMLGTSEVNTTGKKAVIYVIDTAEEFVADDLPKEGNKWKYNATGKSGDLGNHGHLVAGMIAAKNNTIGSLGVAPDAVVIPVKGLHVNSGSYTWLMDAVGYCINNYNKNFKNTHIGIINMSFGGSSAYQPFKDKLQEAVNAGLIPVPAAGNSGGSIKYPGAWDDINITVTAIDKNIKPANFTDRGKAADVSAAGVSVVSVAPNNTYPRVNGTSFAAPIVSGVIAHIVEKHFDKLIGKGADTLKLVEQHLKDFAKDFGTPGEDEFGAGYTIIKPYLDNKFGEEDNNEENPEEPDYPEKEERTLTFEFNDYKIVWGTRMRKLAVDLINLDEEVMPTSSQWMYINKMYVNSTTRLKAEQQYDILKSAFDKFFTRRGLLLFENSDINDAAMWTKRFMEIIIKELDFDVLVMEVSDDNETKLIYNDNNTQ